MHLYVNPNGKPVSIHSYSAGSDWGYCHRRYKLSRIDGWREKEEKASTQFGDAVEAALEYFYKNKKRANSAVEEFVRIWKLLEHNPKYTYTEKEGSWSDLLQMGSEMMTLFEVLEPTFPFGNPRFQLNYKKEVMPNTEYAGIDFTAWVDMLCETDANHPLLPKIDDPLAQLQPSTKRTLVVDIKTAASSLSEIEGLLTLDPQLRSYAWVSGVKDVAFLQFVKARPSYKSGDEVTMLREVKGENFVFPAGIKNVFFPLEKEDREIFGALGVVLTSGKYQEYEKESDGLKGNALKEVKTKYRQFGAVVDQEDITKQKIQFIAVRIPDEAIEDVGNAVSQEIAEIVHANQQGKYPQSGLGVRWPNNKCVNCPMLGICSNNPKLVQEKLVNKKDEKFFGPGLVKTPESNDLYKELEL